MRIEVLKNNLFHFIGDSQYEITSTFMRLQEFYESALPGIKGKFFTHEKLMDLYAEEYGDFTYLQDWTGFNVPSHVVEKFFKLFKDDLNNKELLLQSLINEHKNVEKFYIIGTYDTGDIDHEISHALWYLNPKYKRTSKQLLGTLPNSFYSLITDWLLSEEEGRGYHTSMVLDEMVAYLATSDMWYIGNTMVSSTTRIPWKEIYELQKYFNETKLEFLE